MKQDPSRQKDIFVGFLFLFFLFFFSSLLLLTFSISFYKVPKQAITLRSSLPVVIIDAGHGGEDGGAVGVNGAYEKDINLNVAKKLHSLLRAAGFQAVMTRTEDKLLYDRNAEYEGRKKALDMQARLNMCRQYDHALFISIHQNAFVQKKYSGLQVYYSENNPASQVLASIIQDLSSQSVCTGNDRKIKSAGSNIFLLKQLSLPSVLVECGFLSNQEECEKLTQDSYQTKLAMLLYSSVLEFFAKTDSFESGSS